MCGAFVDFGRVKHGFLAFNDIQSDYYQIPSADKEKLKNVEEKIREDLKNTNLDEINNNQEGSNNSDKNGSAEDQNKNSNVEITENKSNYRDDMIFLSRIELNLLVSYPIIDK